MDMRRKLVLGWIVLAALTVGALALGAAAFINFYVTKESSASDMLLWIIVVFMIFVVVIFPLHNRFGISKVW